MSIFTKVPMKRPPSNIFDLSHDLKITSAFKHLTHVLNMEVVPGDTVTIKIAALQRCLPLVAPVMHQASVYFHAFFVPNRLVWPENPIDDSGGWEKFITGGEDGLDEPVFPFITLNQGNYDTFPIFDEMGLPDPNGSSVEVSAIPFAGRTLIINEYYRDQNLVNEREYKLSDGNNDGNPDLLQPFRRAWMHDYFTSALPWTQKGPEATIPLGTSAGIRRLDNLPFNGTDLNFDATNDPSRIRRVDDTSFGPDDVTFTGPSVSPAITATGTNAQINVQPHTAINLGNLEVALDSATAASINDLRTAFRLQEWLETNARSGTRYTEFILAHFGVRNPDSRLQRPEFIGGISQPIAFSEVLQTSGSNIDGQTTPQGNMSGHGISAGNGSMKPYFVQEYGYIHVIMSVMPKTGYFQGVPKHFFKKDRFEYYFKEFAHLGEQPILNQELYVDDDGLNEDVFGYVPRYAEYKYLPCRVAGLFKNTLDFWHMARKFGARPLLNDGFVSSTDDISRIFVDTESEEQLLSHIYFSIKARRPMPYFGQPKGI